MSPWFGPTTDLRPALSFLISLPRLNARLFSNIWHLSELCSADTNQTNLAHQLDIDGNHADASLAVFFII